MRLGEVGRLAGPDGVDVFLGVDAEEILLGDGLGADDLDVGGIAQAIGDEGKFPDGHEVLADGSGVTGMEVGSQHSVGKTSGTLVSFGG